ncbi:recombinase family protein [bacterium]|nr:recombinase family protein [bacterium]|tara:strand:- start:2403 stop:3074 length:672 start_codon:yes stop_codon:yes gene_type:complete
MKITAYTRCSTELQQNSLDTQMTMIENYNKLYNHELCGVFSDFGLSGKNVDRIEFQQMMDKVIAGEIKTIVVNDLSRLNRNLIDLLNTIKVLENNDCNLISIKEGISLQGSGKMFIQILGVLSEWEREQSAIRTSETLQNLKRQNKVYGQVPYGKTEVDGMLIDNERELFMLRKVNRMKIAGKSYNDIAQFLNRNKYTKKNGTQFTRIDALRLVKKVGNNVSL